jgi:hypothetical protein
MRFHSDVLSWVNVIDGLMYKWDDVKVDVCCLIMVYRKYQIYELQSGPLMVKSITERHFVKSNWLTG